MKENIIGKSFGKLTILEVTKTSPRKHFLCQCSCGNKAVVKESSIKSGKTKSCGCLRKEVAILTNTDHGLSSTKIYKVWMYMRSRCNNKNNKSYSRYGGRGIKVCERWDKFINFYEDMKDEFVSGLSLDRIDNNQGYYKENCRWVSAVVQGNNKRNNILINIGGENKTLSQWCREFGVDYMLTRQRIKRDHWAPIDALEGRKSV